MSRRSLRYGCRSLAALGILLVTTQAFHPALLMAVETGQTAAWLLILLAAALAALTLLPAALLLRAVPGGSLTALAELAFGRIGAAVTGCLLAGALTFTAGMVMRETAEMSISASYPHTPQTFAMVAMMAGAIFIARGDESALVRLGRLMLPVTVAALLLILAGSAAWGDLRYLVPWAGPGPVHLLRGAPDMALLFAPAAVVLVLAGRVQERAGLAFWVPAVPLGSGLLLALTSAVLLMVYPYPLGTHITFPLHAAARILLGGPFFERLEGIWLLMWALSTIVLVGALLHGSAVAFARTFRMPRHGTAVPALATAVATVALFPRNQADTVARHQQPALLLFLTTCALPAALALAAAWRRRRRHHVG